MLEVLKLQKAIEDDVKSEEGIRLKDVCHQPLAPESDACNVQSIWAYWQVSPLMAEIAVRQWEATSQTNFWLIISSRMLHP